MNCDVDTTVEVVWKYHGNSVAMRLKYCENDGAVAHE